MILVPLGILVYRTPFSSTSIGSFTGEAFPEAASALQTTWVVVELTVAEFCVHLKERFLSLTISGDFFHEPGAGEAVPPEATTGVGELLTGTVDKAELCLLREGISERTAPDEATFVEAFFVDAGKPVSGEGVEVLSGLDNDFAPSSAIVVLRLNLGFEVSLLPRGSLAKAVVDANPATAGEGSSEVRGGRLSEDLLERADLGGSDSGETAAAGPVWTGEVGAGSAFMSSLALTGRSVWRLLFLVRAELGTLARFSIPSALPPLASAMNA